MRRGNVDKIRSNRISHSAKLTIGQFPKKRSGLLRSASPFNAGAVDRAALGSGIELQRDGRAACTG